MKKLIKNLSFFIIYAEALALFLILQDADPTNFYLKVIAYVARMGLVLFLVAMPLAIWFEVWGKIKKKLYEKWKKDFEGEEK